MISIWKYRKHWKTKIYNRTAPHKVLLGYFVRCCCSIGLGDGHNVKNRKNYSFIRLEC